MCEQNQIKIISNKIILKIYNKNILKVKNLIKEL